MIFLGCAAEMDASLSSELVGAVMRVNPVLALVFDAAEDSVSGAVMTGRTFLASAVVEGGTLEPSSRALSSSVLFESSASSSDDMSNLSSISSWVNGSLAILRTAWEEGKERREKRKRRQEGG